MGELEKETDLAHYPNLVLLVEASGNLIQYSNQGGIKRGDVVLKETACRSTHELY